MCAKKASRKKQKKINTYDIAKVIEIYASKNNTFVTIGNLKERNYQLEIFFEYGRE